MSKQFKIDKIVLLADGLDAEAIPAAWKGTNPPPLVPDPASIPEAIQPHVADLQALGSTVELTEVLAAVFYPAKVATTGRVYKPKPGPALEYREFTSNGVIIDIATGQAREELHKSAMPYVAGSRAFAHLGKAALRFLTLAREQAPKKD